MRPTETDVLILPVICHPGSKRGILSQPLRIPLIYCIQSQKLFAALTMPHALMPC